jgi:hypothetical protein
MKSSDTLYSGTVPVGIALSQLFYCCYSSSSSSYFSVPRYDIRHKNANTYSYSPPPPRSSTMLF